MFVGISFGWSITLNVLDLFIPITILCLFNLFNFLAGGKSATDLSAAIIKANKDQRVDNVFEWYPEKGLLLVFAKLWLMRKPLAWCQVRCRSQFLHTNIAAGSNRQHRQRSRLASREVSSASRVVVFEQARRFMRLSASRDGMYNWYGQRRHDVAYIHRWCQRS